MLEKKIDLLTATTAELVGVIKDLITKLDSGEITAKPPAKSPAKKKTPAPEATAEKEPIKKDNVEPLKKEDPPKAAKTKAPDIDDARRALLDVKNAFSGNEMHRILSEHGGDAKKMSDVKVEDYPAIIEACEAKLSKLAEAA